MAKKRRATRTLQKKLRRAASSEDGAKRHSTNGVTKNEPVAQARPSTAKFMRPAASRVSKKQQRLAEQTRETCLRNVRIIGLVVIGLALIGGAVAWRNAGIVPADELLETTTPNLDGPDGSLVRIVESGDFGCPSCRVWHNAGIRELVREEFGDQVSFEFRYFPVIMPQSPEATEASQCAAEQGARWPYHDYIYEQTPPDALSVTDLKQYAAAVRLDKGTFDARLDSGKYQSYVTQQIREAFSAGARGTPSVFLNGQLISFSYAGMSAAIRQALSN